MPRSGGGPLGCWRRLLPLAVALWLAGCTASWQAPLETRGADYRPPKIEQNAEYYRVAPGDTLYTIAWSAGADWRHLARWNAVRAPYIIYPGQVLRVKPPRSSAPTRNPQTAVARARPPSAPLAPEAKIPPGRSSAPPARAQKLEPQRHTAVPAPGPLRWAWPTEGAIESTFKPDDPARQGIKVVGRSGQPVRSAEAGSVVYSGSGLIGYGRLIIVKHNDKYLSAYGHNRKLLVKEGDQVTKGAHIAEMGQSSTGQAVLHFEIRRHGKPVDPLALLPRR